ncbi:MAG: hypothetical protein ACREM2_01105 [Vulcanimicrobiaceae bacterium]
MERPARRRSSDHRAFVLGGNAGTLAFVSSLRPERGQVTAWLVPLAWTPLGVVLGEAHQKVNVAADDLVGWVDSTFPADDEQAFVTPAHDIEMLARIGWHAEPPERLAEAVVLNADDLPGDVLDALERPTELLANCALCRRSCVRDDFVWNERQLCAWDYHASVFGKRGPWREGSYDERFFETLPRAAYVVPFLLEELGVEQILATGNLPEERLRALVNLAIGEGSGGSFLAVRTAAGFAVLRERARPANEPPPA